MSLKNKTAISLIEIAFIIFVLFFIYTFVVRQMIADLQFSDLKRSAATTYTDLDTASRKIIGSSGYTNKFKNEKDIILAFATNLPAEKVCQTAKKEECWSSNWLWSDISKPGLKMPSGQYVVAEFTSSGCLSNLNIPNTCGALYVDTNGSLAPNVVGQDIIKLYITKTGLVPAGVKEDIINPVKGCDMIKKFSWGCSAKLLGMK